MLVAALTTNLATRAIWVPFMHVIYCLTQESSKCVSLLNAKKKKMFFIRFIFDETGCHDFVRNFLFYKS